jgi:hypothetical protein
MEKRYRFVFCQNAGNDASAVWRYKLKNPVKTASPTVRVAAQPAAKRNIFIFAAAFVRT